MNSSPAPRRKTAIAVGLSAMLFVGGVVAGVSGHQLWLHRHHPPHHGARHPGADHKIEMFRERLDLTDAQTEEIREIFEDTYGEMKQLHERSQARILEVLDEEQAAEFREMIEHREHRRRRHPHR